MGFTLIELTLVAILVLVLIGISTPLFRKTFSDLTTKNAAFSISKLINYAQERAVVDGKAFTIKFAPQARENKYTQYKLFDGDLPVRGRFGRTFELPQGVILKSSLARIDFYPDGSCSAAEITVSGSSGGNYRIRTKGFGGLAKIEELKNER